MAAASQGAVTSLSAPAVWLGSEITRTRPAGDPAGADLAAIQVSDSIRCCTLAGVLRGAGPGPPPDAPAV